jgi:hypothetical protein
VAAAALWQRSDSGSGFAAVAKRQWQRRRGQWCSGSGSGAAAAAVAAAQQQEGIECPVFVKEIVECFLHDVKVAEDLVARRKYVRRWLFRGIVAHGSGDGRKPTINQMDYSAPPKKPC